jgi:hypothetical protein
MLTMQRRLSEATAETRDMFIQLGQSGPFDLPRNVTNWEFVNVLPNPKTIFVQNGKVVPLESLLQRVNK